MTMRQLAGVRTQPSAVARASHSSVVNRAMPSGVDAGLEH
jgi:hypothetical protein